MRIFSTILFCIQLHLAVSQDIPYRDETTYKLSLKMEFKTEPARSSNEVDLVNVIDRNSGPQLYLNASLELLTLSEGDYRIKIFNGENGLLTSKKLKTPTTFLFKLGYANHMKIGKSPNLFTIQFINKEKKVISQIILEIKEDGDFMVNNKRFGKV